ncbi:NUMOD1 domain-containing DNA-binding protein [Mammaliicoccus lentus]|uniref:NUMOD1 domain-containing DNA-binding protein n=1 Tax=Mammaliicoccus lentus TaxID=42858 RepID=UPI002DB73DB0|nr:NUMOD1 domain-containing DNA-binding protein [Mammaliicoccus lentus]MEB8091875.1 hypothetical protein [Mammaliicoccus lentus]
MEFNITELNNLLKNYYKSKAEMARSLNISKSHLDKVLKGEGIGVKVIEGLKKECLIHNLEFAELTIPPKLILENQIVKSIEIIDSNNEVLASISSRDIIIKEGLDVLFNY